MDLTNQIQACNHRRAIIRNVLQNLPFSLAPAACTLLLLPISYPSERWRGRSMPPAGWGAADASPAPPRPHFEPQLYGLHSGWWTACGLQRCMCDPHVPYPEHPALSTHRTERDTKGGEQEHYLHYFQAGVTLSCPANTEQIEYCLYEQVTKVHWLHTLMIAFIYGCNHSNI